MTSEKCSEFNFHACKSLKKDFEWHGWRFTVTRVLKDTFSVVNNLPLVNYCNLLLNLVIIFRVQFDLFVEKKFF